MSPAVMKPAASPAPRCANGAQEARGVELRARGGAAGGARAGADQGGAAQAPVQQWPEQVHHPGTGDCHQHGLWTLLR